MRLLESLTPLEKMLVDDRDPKEEFKELINNKKLHSINETAISNNVS